MNLEDTMRMLLTGTLAGFDPEVQRILATTIPARMEELRPYSRK